MSNKINAIRQSKTANIQIFLEPLPGEFAGSNQENAFFGLIWTENKNIANDILEFYREAVKNQKIILPFEPERYFENCLQNLNKILAQNISDQDKEALNLLFGLKYKDKVFFTQKGKIFSLLIKKKNQQEIESTALKRFFEESKDQIFPQFLSGNLDLSESVFFATENILQYFSETRLKALLFTSQNALWLIKNDLEKLDKNLSFGALYILPLDQTSLSTEKMENLKNLFKIEKETEQVLTPSLKKHLFNFLKTKILTLKDSQKIKEVAQKIKSFKQNLLAEKAKSSTEKTLIKEKIKKTTAVFKEQLKYQNKKLFDKIIANFNALTFEKKVSVIFSLILLFFFLESIFFLNFSKKNQILDNQTNILAELEQNIAAAKAALIYNDENKAQEYFTLAKQIFDKLETKKLSPEQKTKFFNDLQQIQNRLNKIFEPEAVVIYQFENQQKIPSDILALENHLYLLSDNSLIELEREPKKLNVLYQNLNSTFQKFEIISKTQILLYDLNAGKAISFSLTNKRTNEIKFPFIEIQNIASFQGKFYLLTKDPKEFYRLTPVNNNFSPQPWLKEKIDLEKVRDFAIDGTIYFLTNDNVWQFSQGKKLNFTLPTLNPPLQNAFSIKTKENSPVIYLLEKNRLIILTKKGELLGQINLSSFGTPINFFVDETNKKIYLLSNQGIYELNLKNIFL